MLLRNPALRIFLLANALWEFSFAGLKSFIVLYVVRGLGRSPSVASAVIAIVACAYVIAAPLSVRSPNASVPWPPYAWQASSTAAV